MAVSQPSGPSGKPARVAGRHEDFDGFVGMIDRAASHMRLLGTALTVRLVPQRRYPVWQRQVAPVPRAALLADLAGAVASSTLPLERQEAILALVEEWLWLWEWVGSVFRHLPRAALKELAASARVSDRFCLSDSDIQTGQTLGNMERMIVDHGTETSRRVLWSQSGALGTLGYGVRLWVASAGQLTSRAIFAEDSLN